MPHYSSEFSRKLNGYLCGMLHWTQLDTLWLQVRAQPQGWYASQTGEALPASPLEAPALDKFVTEVDALLRREHQYDFCGIVYVDDPEQPTLIKIYDPHHIGSFCGCSSTPIPPRWLLSRCPPEPSQNDPVVTGSRRTWWHRMFAIGTDRAP